ncbi:MAG: DUF1834 family protein [Nitrospiraceae bacterium]|nr:DUF1834 family protein [Nitrospiraceae bacterium]
MTFQDIENAIIVALQGLSVFKVVKTYAGEASGEIEQLPIQFPSAFVVYSGSKYEWADTKTGMETATFNVLVCARSARTILGGINEDTRENAATGAYALLNAVIPALAWKDLGLALSVPVEPVGIRLLAATKTTVIYALELEAAFDRDYL